MRRKRIRRRVVSVNTSNQKALFEAPLPSTQEHAGTGAASKQAVRFIDPDPALIRINEVRLDELLKQSGQHAPLKIRTWLGELSFEPSSSKPTSPADDRRMPRGRWWV